MLPIHVTLAAREVSSGLYGPQFMGPVVMIGIAAAAVTVAGMAILVAIALVGGLRRLLRR